MIEPVSDALTTSIRPACRAKNAMISSAMLPNVALRIPPTCGPVSEPSRSVDSPTTQARPEDRGRRRRRTGPSGRRAGRSRGRSRRGSARPCRSATTRDQRSRADRGSAVRTGGGAGHRRILSGPVRHGEGLSRARPAASVRRASCPYSGDAASRAPHPPARHPGADQPLDLVDVGPTARPGARPRRPRPAGARPATRRRRSRTRRAAGIAPVGSGRRRQLAERARARSSRGAWSARGRRRRAAPPPQAAARSRSVAATRPGASYTTVAALVGGDPREPLAALAPGPRQEPLERPARPGHAGRRRPPPARPTRPGSARRGRPRRPRPRPARRPGR